MSLTVEENGRRWSIGFAMGNLCVLRRKLWRGKIHKRDVKRHRSGYNFMSGFRCGYNREREDPVFFLPFAILLLLPIAMREFKKDKYKTPALLWSYARCAIYGGIVYAVMLAVDIKKGSDGGIIWGCLALLWLVYAINRAFTEIGVERTIRIQRGALARLTTVEEDL